MREISGDNYGPAAADLISRATADLRPQSLVLGDPASEMRGSLEALSDANISKNRRVRMPHDAQALKAALWLLFDFMTESHDISQAIATPSGSYWHGILHRREPDAFNAKYWMARVGEHPIFPELLEDAREIVAGSAFAESLASMKSWDSNWFVEQCCSKQDSAATEVLLQLQRREWALLFDYNFGKAFA